MGPSLGSEWRGPPTPAQFALRVAILGGVGLVAFAIIFLRLWYLEVLSGDKYLAEAQNNQVREFTVQAPRGKVVDRHGEVLVDNRTALELQVKQTDLPRSPERRARPVRSGSARSPACARSRSATRSAPRRRSAPPVRRPCAATSPTTPSTSCARTRRASPASRSSASTCATTRRARSPRTCSATPARSTPTSSRTRATRRSSRATRSARRGSSTPTTASCAGSNGVSRVQVDAAGQPTGGRLSEREPAHRQRPRADDRRRDPERRRERDRRRSACRAASSR